MKPTVTILLEDYNNLIENQVAYTKRMENGKTICAVDCNMIEQMIATKEEQELTITSVGGYQISKASQHVEVEFVNCD